jgi:hypothetical protein
MKEPVEAELNTRDLTANQTKDYDSKNNLSLKFYSFV